MLHAIIVRVKIQPYKQAGLNHKGKENQNKIMSILCDIIDHPRANFNGGLAKLSLNFVHGIIYFFTKNIISGNNLFTP